MHIRSAWRNQAKRAGLLVLTGLLFVCASIGYFAYDLPLASNLETPSGRSFSFTNTDGNGFAFRGVYQGEAQTFEALPADFVQAVIAIEDRRFFDHAGIDWRGIARATWTNLRAGGVRQGGSTLTQQYVKLAYLSPERSLRRKIQEAILAVWLESRLKKKEIFRRYVNLAYFGAGAYGVDAAAQRYFGKPVGRLDLAESAMLAGLIRAPSHLAPTHNLEAAQARAGTVLKAMIQTGRIEEDRATKAIARPASPKTLAGTSASDAYFADWAQGQTRERLGAAYGDFNVHTTLNPSMQAIAESVINERLAQSGQKLEIGQAALVAMTLDGAVVAMVGGRDYRTSQFNRVTQARRQPGSLFKLFVYQAAFDAGFSPDSRLTDKAITVEGWSPENYSKRNLGPVTLRDAFAKSINTVAVQLAEKVGREKIIEAAVGMGITSPLTANPSLALGTSSVNLLEITAAYGAVAAETARLEPYGVRAIDAGGQPLFQHQTAGGTKPANTRRRTRKVLRDLLASTVEHGTGRAARIGEAAGGKTGTSQDHRDAWFVGFSNDLVVGVWVGNDDNRPMKGVTGGGLPAEIWHDFMLRSRPFRHQAATRIKLTKLPHISAPADITARGKDKREDAGLPGLKSDTAKKPLPLGSQQQQPRKPERFRGSPKVIDTATLRFGETEVRLVGVGRGSESFIGNMTSYIGERQVLCKPYTVQTHRCEVGGFDLSEVVIFNGGARAANDAPAYLRKAEKRARKGRRGIWAR
ncbi:PBP1A family penicillin-binding protein [Pelagibius sp. Alg239-R121]|uniref:PBP1A family penicillin-binding protein n=1 Tax=Pelagibius sp. Alg239-R121 TaxID=2993448 RepID=UPI0024A79EC2|nr:PBP1A family penicillin-binding protein [Pelagibius sp. Alg239-R121]